MKKNDRIYGFFIQNVRPLTELNGLIWEMEHEKSGAKLVWLDRAEENKTFGIAFRTIPEDDTGVFHILEHSVLCGSEKYPVKEPFVELMKSSLQTFLNAMTFPDKTFYPVSSRNHKDFINLVRVYMDAVLRPRIYQCPEIFEQEGWHYEFGPDGDVSYQGVVLNEMKGIFSSPDTLLQREINRQLFPDNCYRYVSGGDPAHIPDLTYERFLDSHLRFYHPSNSYIFLDGKIDLEQILAILDGEYLSAYTRKENTPVIPVQAPVRSAPVRVCYESAPNEPEADRARLVFGYVLGDYTCRREAVAARVLADAICGSNDAPLKRRILSSGLAQDVRIQVNDSGQQTFVTLEAMYLGESRVDEVRAAVVEEIFRLVREGLDHGHLAAALANMEFQMRGRDYGSMPLGLGLGMTVLGSWLYGGDPAANLEVGDLFAELNGALEEGYFEDLLEQIFLQNSHTCEVLLIPSNTVGRERQERETARLQKEQDAWNDERRSALLAQREKRLAWQSAPDTVEALATLPRLSLTDISARPEAVPTLAEELNGLPLLRHPISSGGVDHVNLYFDVSDLGADQVSCLSFLCSLLGTLDTHRYATMELQRLSRLYLGSLRFSVEAYGKVNQPESCRTFLCVSFSAVEEKLPQAVSLIAEILTGTRFDNALKIHELLRQITAGMEPGIAAGGANFAATRVAAGSFAAGAVQEYAGGIAYFMWLKNMERDFESRVGQLQADLENLLAMTAVTGRLSVSVTGQDEKAADTLKKELLNKLPTVPRAELTCAIAPWGVRREGIIVPADVSFAVMGGNVLPYGMTYNGFAPVLGKVMTLGYLWGAVRVQGGAYGTGFGVGDNGSVSFYSYRDPNAARSLNCYRKAPAFIRQLPGMVSDLTDFIIGAVAESEPYMTPRQQGKMADSWYLRGVTYEDRCDRRKELLSTTPADLAFFADPLEKWAEHAGICVIGAQRQIDTCGAELDQVFLL